MTQAHPDEAALIDWAINKIEILQFAVVPGV
jgi:hypothetical protein